MYHTLTTVSPGPICSCVPCVSEQVSCVLMWMPCYRRLKCVGSTGSPTPKQHLCRVGMSSALSKGVQQNMPTTAILNHIESCFSQLGALLRLWSCCLENARQRFHVVCKRLNHLRSCINGAFSSHPSRLKKNSGFTPKTYEKSHRLLKRLLRHTESTFWPKYFWRPCSLTQYCSNTKYLVVFYKFYRAAIKGFRILSVKSHD